MKAFLAIFCIGFVLFFSIISDAETTSPNQPSFRILAYDANGDKIVSKKEITAGLDKFLARKATMAEVSAHPLHLFKAQDNQYYIPVTIAELEKIDKDYNRALTADEYHALGIRLAIYLPDAKQYTVSSLTENGISYIRLKAGNSETEIELVPLLGETPIKIYNVEMDKL